MSIFVTGHLAAAGIKIVRPYADSLWIWQTPMAEWPDAGAFAAENGFRTVYLNLSSVERTALLASPDLIEDALAPFIGNGIKVYLSGGDPTWINSGSLPSAFTQMVTLATMYPRIEGIQLDLEVHTHTNWNSNRTDVIAKTMAFMTSARAATTGMTFGNILHPSYASTTLNPPPTLPDNTGNLADGIIANSDRLVLLGFRNTVSGLLTYNTNLLAALDRNPKTWTWGITFNGGQTFTYISYADRTTPWADARADMLALRSSVKGRAAEPFLEGTAVQAFKLLQPLIE